MRRWLLLTGLAVLVASAVVVGRNVPRGPAPWDRWRPEPVTLPSPNGYDAFVAAERDAWELPKERSGDKTTDADLDELVSRNAATFDRIRDALRLQFVTPAQPDPWKLFDNEHRLRFVSYLLKTAAQRHAAHERYAEVVRCRLDLVELLLKQPHGSVMMDMLSAASSERAAVSPPSEIAGLTGPEAAAVAQRLEAIRAERITMVEVVRGERRYLLPICANGLRQYSLHAVVASMDERAPTWSSAVAYVRGGKQRVWRELLRYYDDCERAAAAPLAHERFPRPATYGPVVDAMADTFGDGSRCLAAAATETNLWLTALALRAYQAEHGEYPESLSALVPRYLTAVPQDPFALAPLRYHRDGGTYLLYSVWLDGVDDGGVETTTKAKDQSWLRDKGDKAWRPAG